MKIDHIGYAVADIRRAAAAFSRLGYSGGEIVCDAARKVDICFMTNGGYRIELVSPAAAGSPVDVFLKKNGDGPYHICYMTQDMDTEIANLLSEKPRGFRLVAPPAPAAALGGRRVAFLYRLDMGLIELLEEAAHG